ncbi:hypothetical protein [Enterobacter phage SDFMU_Pec]|uniref:Uncharacterized protein n=1 Tax=Enterobacter phage SDFMU_Pec TaxID=3076136 RepID=A0AA96R0S9_9CAUD|nr:hypothetical protein [Enterobacter phage SDFMU_Pec]
MSVTRYDLTEDLATGEVDITPVPETQAGGYVAYEDYAAMEARCAALAAENAGLKSVIEKHADSYIMCGYCRTERDGKNDDVCEVLDSTPATDAFLAEVRAQESKRVYESILDNPAVTGMESLVDWLEQNANDSVAFTAQLRKGGA